MTSFAARILMDVLAPPVTLPVVMAAYVVEVAAKVALFRLCRG